MSKGFFPSSLLMARKAPESLSPRCGDCGLYKTCNTPRMPVNGEGRRKILLVGEAPGANEDMEGVPFIGKAGELLQSTLKKCGVNMRQDCWITNAVICRPENNKTPDPRKVAACRPNLLKTVSDLNPEVIIPIGSAAVQSLIGGTWKEGVGTLARWVGWQIPSTSPNAWICPTYHPSWLQREHDATLDMFFYRHLKAACSLSGHPWKTIPDYKSQVEVILDPAQAARILRKMVEKGGLAAVDYECTALKPEYDGAEIVCCSVCFEGRKTIAYPWHGEAVLATRELLVSPRIFKIASNLKYEDRWSRRDSGHRVRNWVWDTMLAAHVLDNRAGGICGLKFQAYVTLGAESYDEHIKEFLKSIKGSKTNRVREEIDIYQLLTYCGTDTLLEYLLAVIQMEKMGFDRTTLTVQ